MLSNSDVSIRRLEGEEMLDTLHKVSAYAFIPSPPLDIKTIDDFYQGRQGITCFALFEGENAAAVAISDAMTQNVRGVIYPACGIEGVATLPLARRKGYVRQLMAHLFEVERQAGVVFSCLYPFRESFYERLGYVSFPAAISVTFQAAALAPLAKNELRADEVELLPMREGYPIYRRYLHRFQPGVHGWAIMDGDLPEPARGDYWVLLAKQEGEIQGLMLYRLKGDTAKFGNVDVEGQYLFQVIRFYYATSWGKYTLLSWIARHIDQARRVKLWLPPYEHPETWLADLNVRIESQDQAPMARVLDVARLGEMRIGQGSFVANIIDPECPWNEGGWQFRAIEGKLEVSRTEQIGCDLTIQGLTALVYGTHPPDDFVFRGWGDPSQEEQMNMQRVFPVMLPYMHENF